MKLRQTRFFARQQRRSDHSANCVSGARRCLFEPLEDRRLLACDVRLEGRTLFVRGDEGANQISVGQRNDQVIVTCDRIITRVPSDDIDAVRVKGGEGNDSINVARVDPTLNVLGDAGNDSIHVIIDVNDDGQINPTDSIAGGGGDDTLEISTSVLAEIIKIVGTGDRILPDPDISVISRATGNVMAQLQVQETEAIMVNTRGGDDQVEMLNNQGLLAGIDWTINTGDGADDVRFVAVTDPNNPAACPSAPERLTVNLGSTPGPDDMSGFLAEDHFLLDATAGWCPSDPSIPATIDVLGGRGTQQATLKFGQIGEPVPGNQMPNGLMIHLALGAGDDSGDVSYGTGIYMPVQLDGDLGGGNDAFAAAFVPDSRAAQGSNTWTGHVRGGGGNDTFRVAVGDVNVPPPDPDTPQPHLATALDVNFDGGAGDDSFFDVFHNVQLDAPVKMNLVGAAGNDFFDPTVDIVITQVFLVTEDGGDGDDTFSDSWNNTEWRGPVTLDYRGGKGNDKFSEAMQKVQVSAGFMMNVDGGLGDDRAALEVREAACPSDPSLPPGPCQPIDIDIATGGGRDTVEATVQDLGVDLHFDANLGGGNDIFLGTIMPDSSVGPGGGCIEANVNGGGGRDTFMMHTGGVNSPVPGDDIPHIAAELMLNFDGGAGGDAFLIGLLNVAIDGPVTIIEVGGEGNDSFHDTFSQVAANGGVWNIAHQGGAGHDSLHSSFFDVFADVSIGADLGSGNDTAVIAIIRKAAPSELVPAVRIEVAGGEGNDDVTLAVDQAIRDFAATLDGGDGRDVARITQNVKDKGKIVNFEKIVVTP